MVKSEGVLMKQETADDPKPAEDSSGEETSKKTTSSVPEEKKFELLNDVAEFHSSLVRKMKEREELVSNIGPYRRALCARRDLAIRRALCKAEKVFCFVLISLLLGLF